MQPTTMRPNPHPRPSDTLLAEPSYGSAPTPTTTRYQKNVQSRTVTTSSTTTQKGCATWHETTSHPLTTNYYDTCASTTSNYAQTSSRRRSPSENKLRSFFHRMCRPPRHGPRRAPLQQPPTNNGMDNGNVTIHRQRLR